MQERQKVSIPVQRSGSAPLKHADVMRTSETEGSAERQG